MDLSLKYTTNSDSVKSQSSQGQIGLMLSYNGKPYDLHVISDGTITAKIGNDNGFIQDINIDLSKLDDDAKYRGTFTIPLDDPNIQNLPPDTYYLEVWINVKDQNNNENNLIFPSEGVLPFMLSANIVDGSNSMPMITYENIQKNINDFEDLVMQNQAKLSKDLSTMDTTTSNFVDKVDSGVSGYSKFVNSADDNLTSMASSGASYINNAVEYANNNVSDINSKVDSARGVIVTAADNVFSTVDSDVNSAKASITGVVNSADTDTTGTASYATSTVDSEARSVVDNVTSTMNSADNHINHAADGIRGQVNGIVTSGNNYINNVKANVEDIANSAVSNITTSASVLDSKTDSAVQNINFAVNSADNHANDLAKDTDNKLSSADSHVGSNVSSAENEVDNHLTGADSHIDSDVSSADNHIDNRVSTGEDSIVTTTNSAVGRINNDTSIINSDAASVTDMSHKYSTDMSNQANSAYNNINNNGKSVYSGINGSAQDVYNNINNSADSAYTGISVSASSAYINIDGYNSSASNAISGDTSSGIKNVNSAYGQASSALQFAIDHSGQLIESDITNAVKSSVSDDFNNQAKSVQAQVGQTSNDVSTIQNSITSLSNSTGSMAINVNNQANAHADSKASDLQDQITSNYLYGIEHRGNIHYWALDQELDIGIYSIPGYAIWDIPYNDNNAWYGSLIVLPGRDPSYKVQILIDDNNAGSGKSIISWRCVGPNINNAWHVEVDQDDLSNTFNQAKEYIDNKTNDLQNQITTNNNNHNGTESNLQNQINQNKNDILNNNLQEIPTKDFNKILNGSFKITNEDHVINKPANCDANWGFIFCYLINQHVSYQLFIDGSSERSYFRVGFGNVKDWMDWKQTSTIDDFNALQDKIDNINNDNKTQIANVNNIINQNQQYHLTNSLQEVQTNDFNKMLHGSFKISNNTNMINAPKGASSNWGFVFCYSVDGNISYQLFIDGPDQRVYTRIGWGKTDVWAPWQLMSNEQNMNDLKNFIQKQLDNRPQWGDENYTRNVIAPSAATNAMNQANAYTNNKVDNLQNQINTNATLDLPAKDFNQLLQGSYKLSGVNNMANKPKGANGSWGFVICYCIPSRVSVQYYTDGPTQNTYIRVGFGVTNSWTDWKQVAMDEDIQDLQNKIDVLNNHANNVDGKINEAEQMAMQMKSNYDSEISQLKDHDREIAEALKSVTDALRQLSANTNDYNYNDDLDFISSQVEAISNGMLD